MSLPFHGRAGGRQAPARSRWWFFRGASPDGLGFFGLPLLWVPSAGSFSVRNFFGYVTLYRHLFAPRSACSDPISILFLLRRGHPIPPARHTIKMVVWSNSISSLTGSPKRVRGARKIDAGGTRRESQKMRARQDRVNVKQRASRAVHIAARQATQLATRLAKRQVIEQRIAEKRARGKTLAGGRPTPEYKAYVNMLDRCYNVANTAYLNYEDVVLPSAHDGSDQMASLTSAMTWVCALKASRRTGAHCTRSTGLTTSYSIHPRQRSGRRKKSNMHPVRYVELVSAYQAQTLTYAEGIPSFSGDANPNHLESKNQKATQERGFHATRDCSSRRCLGSQPAGRARKVDGWRGQR
jgi:hypothetical protein